MDKSKWLVVGGRAEITSKHIKYIPEFNKNRFGKDEPIAAFVKSNVEFENGRIEFTANLKDPKGQCQIVLGINTGPYLNVGINTNDRVFGITKFDNHSNQWNLLSGSGDLTEISLETDYKISIHVFGSIITLYVNDIDVASAIHEVRQAQLQLAFSSLKEIVVKDFRVIHEKPKAFIVMQFSKEFNELYDEVIKPVCQEFGLDCERADEFFSASPIIQDIVNSLKSSSVIIADITPDNPNVFYELGYAHAIGKPTILLCDRKREKLPFDISGFRTLFYENSISGKTRVESNLRKYLENIF